MACELCGYEGPLVKARIEGIMLNVCKLCAKHGTVLQEVSNNVFVKTSDKFDKKINVEESIVDNYPKLVRDARQKLGLTIPELGQKVAERESVLSKIETGALKPDLQLAKRLQKALNIKLIEQIEF